jgi:hypothetical protein
MRFLSLASIQNALATDKESRGEGRQERSDGEIRIHSKMEVNRGKPHSVTGAPTDGLQLAVQVLKLKYTVPLCQTRESRPGCIPPFTMERVRWITEF